MQLTAAQNIETPNSLPVSFLLEGGDGVKKYAKNDLMRLWLDTYITQFNVSGLKQKK